jgi:hypothetical protein
MKTLQKILQKLMETKSKLNISQRQFNFERNYL